MTTPLTPAQIDLSRRLDSCIDYELVRLGLEDDLHCWNTPTTVEDGLVTLHDTQEVTLCRGAALRTTLRTLEPGVSWDAFWHAIQPHIVDA